MDNLIKEGWLKTPRIIEAFSIIKREDFLPEDLKGLAGKDQALPIGFGQTISQPLVVAFMLELLQPKAGDKILDIGFGSGWTSALLGHIVGEKGKVFALEIIPELVDFGRRNVRKYGLRNVKCIQADGSKGYSKEAPFDGILASASGSAVPEAWKGQVKVGGRIVAPVENSIWLIEKQFEKKFKQKEHPGFVFVPLV